MKRIKQKNKTKQNKKQTKQTKQNKTKQNKKRNLNIKRHLLQSDQNTGTTLLPSDDDMCFTVSTCNRQTQAVPQTWSNNRKSLITNLSAGS